MAFMTRDRGPLPPVILLLFILLQIALHRFLPVLTIVPQPWNWLGLLVILAGVVIILSPAIDFRRSETTIIPFQESSKLVITGMYRITRNPMYVGMVCILFGIAVISGRLSPFVVPLIFIPVLNSRVIRHEEAMLEERFGEEYTDYRRKVRRWL